MCKLIIALYVVTAMTVQFSTINALDNRETGVLLVVWDKPQQFCGAFLGDLIKEICKGDLSEDWKNYTTKPLATECCVSKCSALDLQQQYCKNKRPATKPYIYVPTKNKTVYRLSKRDTINSVSTTTPVPLYRPNYGNWFEMILRNLILQPIQNLPAPIPNYRPALVYHGQTHDTPNGGMPVIKLNNTKTPA